MNRLLLAFRDTSPMFKLGFVLAVLVLLLAVGGSVGSFFYSRGKEALKEENRALQSKYDALLGESRAHEQAAKENKLKADALKAAIEKGNAKVKALDDEYEKAVGRYEDKKNNPDECIDGDCIKQLELELIRAGYIKAQ